MWILVALDAGPRTASRLLDDIGAMDGQVGPGTLYGAVARLERLGLIERVMVDGGPPRYRLAKRRVGPFVPARGGPPA